MKSKAEYVARFRKGFVVKHMLTREPLVGWYDDDGAVRNWESDRVEAFISQMYDELLPPEEHQEKERCNKCILENNKGVCDQCNPEKQQGESCVCLLNEYGLHDRYNCTCQRHCDRENPVPEEDIRIDCSHCKGEGEKKCLKTKTTGTNIPKAAHITYAIHTHYFEVQIVKHPAITNRFDTYSICRKCGEVKQIAT